MIPGSYAARCLMRRIWTGRPLATTGCGDVPDVQTGGDSCQRRVFAEFGLYVSDNGEQVGGGRGSAPAAVTANPGQHEGDKTLAIRPVSHAECAPSPPATMG
jgi:hypothetical protein